MHTALVVLPFFSDSLPVPHLGLACLSAFLRERGMPITVLDLATEAQGYQTRLPRITDRNGEIPELPALPLLCLLIDKHLAGQTLSYLVDPTPDNAVLTRYAVGQGLAPKHLLQEIWYIHAFVRTYTQLLLTFDTVAFSLTATNLYASALMALTLREWKPDITIIVGGPHATQSEWACRLFLSFEIADAVVRGEGEESLHTLLHRIQEGADIEGLPGTMTLCNEADYVYTPREAISDLDTLPTPDFSQFSLAKYTPFTLPIYSSRGCPFRCAFCAEHDMFGKFRRRTPRRVVEDCATLSLGYRARFFRFADSLLNASESWLDEFAERLIKAELDIRWRGFFRAGITERMVAKLKRAGLESAAIGVESFSDTVLGSMDKGRTESSNLRSVELFLSHGINSRFNIVTGFPGETQQAFLHTLQQAEALLETARNGSCGSLLAMSAEPFCVMPGSRVYANPHQFGVEIERGLGAEYRGLISDQVWEFVKRVPTSFKTQDTSTAEVHQRHRILESLASSTNYWGAYAPPADLVADELEPDDVLLVNEEWAPIQPIPSNGSGVVAKVQLPNDRIEMPLNSAELQIIHALRSPRTVKSILSHEAARTRPHLDEAEIVQFLSILIRNRLVRVEANAVDRHRR
jgi:radical SAM superfamily enzyme YgiQ (UPF0313 family)